MTTDTYEFECQVLLKKIFKSAKKQGFKSAFKDGFEFQNKYFIGLEVSGIEKIDKEKDLFIESSEGGFWRIPLRKNGPRKGISWWPSEDQIPNKEVVQVLTDLYAFLTA